MAMETLTLAIVVLLARLMIDRTGAYGLFRRRASPPAKTV